MASGYLALLVHWAGLALGLPPQPLHCQSADAPREQLGERFQPLCGRQILIVMHDLLLRREEFPPHQVISRSEAEM
jgi:hypothetical protein